MANLLRVGTDADLDGIWELFRIGFGQPRRARDQWAPSLDPARTVLVDGRHGEVAAASHVRTARQCFGGRAVALAAFSPVAVLPEHRGRGLGRAVTVGQLPHLRERGEVIAGLFPATFGLYRPCGFEIAGSYVERWFPAAAVGAIDASTALAPVRRGTPDDVAAVHRFQAELALRRDGAIVRGPWWWSRLLPDDLGDSYLYVVDHPERRGEVIGYAIFGHRPAAAPYDYEVDVGEVLAEDPDVVRSLWRVVGSSGSQAPHVVVRGPAEDDLLLLIDHAPPEVVRSEIRWMLRLVDAAGAVAARGWPLSAGARVELEIDDPHAPWNHGRWILEVADGEGRLHRGGQGEIEVSIGALSSWWAGYATPHRLARAGGLRTARPELLDAMAGLLPAAPPVLPDFY
jgi:predicted acetyltransferase